MIATAYGGRPEDEATAPEGIIVTEILAPPRFPAWPWTSRRMRRKIGWVMYEVHPVSVSVPFTVYSRTGDQAK
jgi:hypothetical protein